MELLTNDMPLNSFQGPRRLFIQKSYPYLAGSGQFDYLFPINAQTRTLSM